MRLTTFVSSLNKMVILQYTFSFFTFVTLAIASENMHSFVTYLLK